MKPAARRDALRGLYDSLSVEARERLMTLAPESRQALEDWALRPWTRRVRRDRAEQLEDVLLTGVVHTGLAGEGGLRAPMLTMLTGPWDWENGTSRRES